MCLDYILCWLFFPRLEAHFRIHLCSASKEDCRLLYSGDEIDLLRCSWLSLTLSLYETTWNCVIIVLVIQYSFMCGLLPCNFSKLSPLNEGIKSTSFAMSPFPCFLHSSVLWMLHSSVLSMGTSIEGFSSAVSTSECWDGSQVSKLLLHASHVALPTKIS